MQAANPPPRSFRKVENQDIVAEKSASGPISPGNPPGGPSPPPPAPHASVNNTGRGLKTESSPPSVILVMALRYAADKGPRSQSGLRNADCDPSMPQQDPSALDFDFGVDLGPGQCSNDNGHHFDTVHEEEDFHKLFPSDPHTASNFSASAAMPYLHDLDPVSNAFAIEDESSSESSQSESSTERSRRGQNYRGSATSLCSIANVPMSNNGNLANTDTALEREAVHQMGNLGMESTVASRNSSLSWSPDFRPHGLPGVTIPNLTSQDTTDSNVRTCTGTVHYQRG